MPDESETFPMSPEPAARSRRAVDALLAAGVARALVPRLPDVPSVFVVTGDGGAGKSHTLRHAQATAGVPVRYAAASEMSVRRPYAFVADLLGTVPDRPLLPDTDRRLLDRLDAMCAAGPLVLAGDDAHLADASSLAVLDLIASAARHLPLVLLLTRRPLPEREHLTRLLRRPDVREVVLPEMDGIDLDALVHDRTGRWPGPSLGSMLLRHAGSALHAVTVLDDLRRSGALTPDGPLDLLPGRTASAPALRAPQDVIEVELAELEGPARQVVRALAVIGGPAAVEDAAAIGGMEPVAAVEPVQWLLDRGVLVFESGGRLTFTHDGYREAVLRRVPTPLLRLLHAAAARRADATGRAHHVIASGAPPAEVLAALRDAGRELEHAPAVEADLLQDASGSVGASAVAAVKLAIGRTRALARSGQMRRAEETARTALVLAEDPADVVALNRVLIFAATTRGDTGLALEMVDRTLSRPLPEHVRAILTDHRRQLVQLGGLEPLALRSPVPDPHALTLTGLVTEAVRNCLTGAPHVAVELAWEASRQHRSPHVDPDEGSSGDVWPPFIELYLGGPAAARVALREVERLRQERAAAWQTAPHQLIAASIDLVAGRLADAAATFDTGLDLAEAGEIGWVSSAVGARALVDVLRGDLDAAERRLDQWDAEPRPLQFGIPQPDRARVALLEARRRHAEAARLARTVWERAAAQHCFVWLGAVAPELSRVALRAADEGLRSAIARDLARLPRPLSPAAEPGVLLAEALAGADMPGIVAAATSAAAGAAAVDDGLTELAAWEEAAVAAAHLGDRDRARRLGRKALECAARAGADAVTARVVGRLRAAGVRFGSGVGRRRPTTGWDSLTPTETQVAHLVAEGLSGPDIAQRLHISPRTVQTHVSHALVKLGLGNRLELATATAARVGGARSS